LCEPSILRSDKEHFRKTLEKFFGSKINNMDQKVIEDLFYEIDAQRDGVIDVNELGKTLGIFYKSEQKFKEFLSI
jgi:Ca2+-binding EF-hand superfamily protein